MEQIHMEKKVSSRSASVAKQGPDSVKTRGDYVSRKKNVYQPKRKEYEKSEPKRAQANRGWTGPRNVRPREKVDSQVASRQYELGSIQHTGRKKQNENFDYSHMFFDYGRNQTRSSRTFHGYHGNSRLKSSDYSKENFLQANCQFVVPSGRDYSAYKKNPDQLVDWDLVEEVKLHSSVSPNCPICLYDPVAAKITKCGHIFCYPCILHYLALSDHKWRKCPICFEPVQKDYLKSVVYVENHDYSVGDEISFTLMKRFKDSLIATPASDQIDDSTDMPSYSNDDINNKFKLITATHVEISEKIIDRELKELQERYVNESDQPEICFTEQAIQLVNDRLKHVKLEASMQDLHIVHSCPVLQFPLDEDQAALANASSVSESLSDQFSFQKDRDAVEHNKLSYFYQASDGMYFYMHSLNVQMLKCEYLQLEDSPCTVKGRIVDKDTYSMTKELRQRFRYLAHLPLACQFTIAEIEILEPALTPDTIKYFKPQVQQRIKMRKKKQDAVMEIERRVQMEEDKMYGRATSWENVHFESLEQFPDFTREPSLVHERMVEQNALSITPDSSTLSFAQKLQAGKKTFSDTNNKKSFPEASSIQSNSSSISFDDNDDVYDRNRTERNFNFADLLNMAEQKKAKEAKRNGKKKKKGATIKLTGGGI